MAAAYFSIGGLVELFPAQATAVVVLGTLLRLVMVLAVIGLVTVNDGSTFARLIESHHRPAQGECALQKPGNSVAVFIDAKTHQNDNVYWFFTSKLEATNDLEDQPEAC